MPNDGVTKEAVREKINQGMRTATVLTEENEANLGENMSIDMTRRDIEFIDKALLTKNLELSNEEIIKLKVIKSRDKSHDLVNRSKFSGDSKEMKDVKEKVESLEKLLATEYENGIENEDIVKIEEAYSKAILSCKYYCDNKDPSFPTGKARKRAVENKLMVLKTEMEAVSISKRIIRDGLDEMPKNGRELVYLGRLYKTYTKPKKDVQRAFHDDEGADEAEVVRVQKDLHETTKSIMDILMLRDIPSLVDKMKAQEKKNGGIREMRYRFIAVYNELTKLEKGKHDSVAFTTADGVIRLIKEEDGSLYFSVRGKETRLPYTVDYIMDRMENTAVENEEALGLKNVKTVVNHAVVKAGELKEDDAAGILRRRNLCVRFLQNRLGFEDISVFNNVSSEELFAITRDYFNNRFDSSQIKGRLLRQRKKDTLDTINGTDTLEILKSTGKIKPADLEEKVKMSDEIKKGEEISEEKQVQNLISDLIFSQETWKADESKQQPGVRIKNMLAAHMSTLLLLIKKPELVPDMVSRIPLSVDNDSEEIRKQITDGFNAIINDENVRSVFYAPEGANSFIKAIKESDAARTAALVVALSAPAHQEKFAELDKKIDEYIDKASDEIQKNVESAVNSLFSDDNNAPLEEVKDPNQTGISEEEKKARIKAGDERLNKILEDAAKGNSGQGMFIKLVMKNYFKSSNILDKRAMFASAIRNTVLFKEEPENILNKKINAYAKKKAEKGEEIKDEDIEKIKKDFDDEIMGGYLGGILKGAGPLLQKMLQGLPIESMPKSLKTAVSDMKSRLAPIPDEIVKARMLAMVQSSKGTVTKIEVQKALGAASVGQAFLCKIYGPAMGPQGKEVVIKLLRPDVRNRMERERELMERCAAQTSEGMARTYKGQLLRIKEEMDLTIEAKNAEKGRVYNKKLPAKIDDVGVVETMKLNQMIEPATDSLVLEKAPGETVDRYMEEVREKVDGYIKLLTGKNTNLEEDGVIRPEILQSNSHIMLEARKELDDVAKQLRKRQAHLVALSKKWIHEGIYEEGFYHGDLHSGNIMVDDEKATVIDYGNATQLTKEQQEHITRMMIAASLGDVQAFRHGFHMLLDDPEACEYDKKRGQLTRIISDIFKLGDRKSAGKRIAAVLLKAQEIGLELPAAIHNFSQCQLRLESAVGEMDNQLDKISKFIKGMDKGVESTQENSFDFVYSHISRTGLNNSIAQKRTDLGEVARSLGYHDKEQFKFILDQKSEDTIREYRKVNMINKSKVLDRMRDTFSEFLDAKPEVVDVFKVALKKDWEEELPSFKPYLKDQYQPFVDGLLSDLDNYEANTDKIMNKLNDLDQYCTLDRKIDAYLYHRDEKKKSEEELAAMKEELTLEWDQGQKEIDEYLKEKALVFHKDYLDMGDEFAAKVEGDMKEWFEDEKYGPDLKKAYDDFRKLQREYFALKDANNGDEEKPEVKESKSKSDKARDEFLDLYSKDTVEYLLEVDKTYKKIQDDPTDTSSPGTFFSAMGDVLEYHFDRTVKRMGYLKAWKYRKELA